MKCPNCGLENDNRNVCRKCGNFLYNINQRNRYVLTPQERRKNIIRMIGFFITRTLLICAVLIGLMLVTVLIVLALQYLGERLL